MGFLDGQGKLAQQETIFPIADWLICMGRSLDLGRCVNGFCRPAGHGGMLVLETVDMSGCLVNPSLGGSL